MKTILCSLIAFLCLLPLSKAQNGCTDPLATNYDADAVSNDGSCVYAPTTYNLQLIADLPVELEETSGLAYFSESLWSLNDTDNPNEIYAIDTLSGEVLQTVVLDTFSNVDWEEMAEDASHLYVGDFGNNAGNRRNLRILRVKKAMLSNDTVEVEEIRFTFSDQTDFSLRPNNHDFDCEAFICHGDSLHLFTKNWVDNKTRHYTLPAEPGDQVARLKSTFDVDGLITAADINEDGVIVLLGYQGVNNFLWLLFDYPANQFFEGNKRRIELGLVLTNGQTEGLSFDDRGRGGYISSERLSALGVTIPQKLFRFTVDQWTAPGIISTQDLNRPQKPIVGPNPFDDQLWLEWPAGFSETTRLYLLNQYGQQLETRLLPDQSGSGRQYSGLELDVWPTGIYYLILQQGHRKWIYKLIKNAG